VNPTLALAAWVVLLSALFAFDPAKYTKASAALWVPVVWMFFLASRPPAMWLGITSGADAAQALEDGNPLDRTILSLLTLIAISILMSRSFQWSKFAANNCALVSFVAFGLLSVVWSDFPLATFKKWFRDVGVYMAALVVLSDPHPLQAVRAVLRRVSYLLVPLSILLIKYYPSLGKKWSPWGGQEFLGVSTSKNMLGVLCLVSGIFFFWDTITRWHGRGEVRTRQIIIVNIAFVLMTAWLLSVSESKTSTICLVLGCLMIATAHSNVGERHPNWLRALAPLSFLVYLILAVGFDMGGQFAEAAGRDAAMSGRSQIWNALLSEPINPLLGTGYQTFWLGPRVQSVWSKLDGDNVLSAHNGYLQIYLDLGLIGLSIVCMFLIATYRKVCKRLDPFTPLGSLGFGLWSLILFYNITEASLEMNFLLLTFLLGAISVTECAEDRVTAALPLNLDFTKRSDVRIVARLRKTGGPRGSSVGRRTGNRGAAAAQNSGRASR
jgi:O-antigen ligase